MNCIWMEVVPAVCLKITGADTMVWSTVIIAVFTTLLFAWQWRQFRHTKKVANANYKFSLYERRLETYLHVRQMMWMFFRDGQPSLKDAVDLASHAQTAKFLFSSDVISLLEEISRKAIEYDRHHQIWEPLRARAFAGETLGPDEDAQKKSALKAKHEIELWFHEQLKDGKFTSVFEPYLNLPEKL